MSLLSWLRSWNRSSPRGRRVPQARRRQRASTRLCVEPLESRDVPSTLTVTSLTDLGNPGDGSLRSAITAAQAGDTIVLDSSLSGQGITLTSGQLVINKSLTIQGMTVDGGGWRGGSRVFEVDGATTNVTLSGLTISGGLGTAFPQSFQRPDPFDGLGGAIYNAGNLTISLSYCTDNGGAYDSSGTITSTVRAGGGIYNAGTLTIRGSTINGNYAGDAYNGHAGNGGGIYNVGTLAVGGTQLYDNHAYGSGADGGNGGGIYNALNATASITATHITYNSASALGGGIYNAATLTLSNSFVESNTAGSKGGGIFNDKKGHLTIQSSTVRYNYDPQGVNLWNLGQMQIKDSYVAGIRHP